MNQDLKTCTYTVKTGKRSISVNQTLMYVIEINKELEAASGVDLVSAAAAGIDSVAAVKIVRSLGLAGRAYIKPMNGKNYLILKGNPGQRAVLNGTRYLASNPTVAHIAVSPKSLAKGAARMTAIAVVAYTSLRVVEALLTQNDPKFIQLIGTVASDLIKFAVAAGAGFLMGAAVGAFTTIAAGPIVAAILVGVFASVALSRLDRKFGLTEQLVLTLEKAADKAFSPFEYVARQVHLWEQSIIQKAMSKVIP